MEGTDGGSSGVGFGSITRAEAAIIGSGVWEFEREREKRREENRVRGKKSLSKEFGVFIS